MLTNATLLAVLLQAPRAAHAPEDAYALVFASGRSGGGDLYVLAPGESTPRLFAGTEAPEGTPRWDAARSRVVYQRFPADGAEEPTLLVGRGAAEGAESGKVLFADPNGDAPPVWSPDGSRIAYVAERDGRTDLFLADADGGSERRLTDDAIVDRYPAWHPDGKRLVVARRLAGGWDLCTLDVDEPGAEPLRVTRDERYVGHPAWSPDGGSIAFDTTFAGDAEIALVDVETGEVRRLTKRPGNDLVPAWSPGGAWIAFGGVRPADGNWDLWRVEVATGETRRLTEHAAFDGAPVFVPAALLE
ncbi:MAG: hypothetical protein AAF682_08205 [Planctomycetota bacterium]